MNEQKQNQKELLYNPKNWVFLTLFFSPLLPAICYYRNCKLLHTDQKGKRVLVATVLFVLVYLSLIFIFGSYTFLILLIGTIIAVILAKKIAKTQLAAYEQMKEDRGLKGGRNEAPLILLFLAVWIMVGVVIPYATYRFIDTHYLTTTVGGKTIYIPRNTNSNTTPNLDVQNKPEHENVYPTTTSQINTTSTELPQNPLTHSKETTQKTDQVYVNTAYNYSFTYPEHTVLRGSEDAREPSKISDEYQVSVYADQPPYLEPLFTVRALDPARLQDIRDPENTEKLLHADTIKTYELPLKEFVDLLVQKNIEKSGEKSVMPPIRLALHTSVAYELWALGNSWKTEYFSYTFTRDHAFYYSEHNGIKFEVHFPIGSEISEDILASFTWTN